MSQQPNTDEEPTEKQDASLSRRTMLKATAAGGAVAATAGTATAQESEPLRTYELIGRRDGWEGVAPESIAGEDNPTLDMVADEQFEVVWENGDGIPHNFNIEGGHGQSVVSSDLVSEEGASQTVSFTASSDFQEYFCQPHPEAMRGNVNIVDSLDSGPSGATLSVTVENGAGEPVSAVVSIDGTDKETTADSPTVEYLLSNGEYTVSVDPNEYYPSASQTVTIDGSNVQTTITVASDSGSYINVSNHASNGPTVTVDSVTLPEGGYVSVQDPTNFTNFDDGSETDDPFNREFSTFFSKTVLGATEYLESGTHENVEVELNGDFDATTRLLFMAHRDTGESESLEYVSTNGSEDAGYLFTANNPVANDAMVEYTEPTPSPTPEPTPEPTDEPTDESTAEPTTSTESPGFGGLSALAGVGAGAAAAARRLTRRNDSEIDPDEDVADATDDETTDDAE